MKHLHMSLVKEIPTQPQMDLEPLRRFVKNEIIPGASAREKTETFPLDLFRKLDQMGWLQLMVPASLGGTPVTTTDLAWISRELAYGSSGMFISLMANLIANSIIFRYGNEALQQQLRAEIAADLTLSSFCWTEADSGSDVFRIQTRATPVKDGYLLHGSKCFVTNANYADRFVVVARIEGAEPKKSLSLFYVPRSSPGLTIGQPLRKMGQSDSNTGEIFLEGVSVPTVHRLGGGGQAPSICVHNLQRTRTMIAAAGVGVCQRAHDLVQEHLAKRVLYGKPLAEQPVIQNFVAQLTTEVHAAWLMVCSAAATWDAGVNSCSESSMAKLFSAHTAAKFTNEAVELFGGYGYMKEYEIERLFRDAKFFEIAEGPSFVQQIIIAKEIFARAAGSAVAPPENLLHPTEKAS